MGKYFAKAGSCGSKGTNCTEAGRISGIFIDVLQMQKLEPVTSWRDGSQRPQSVVGVKWKAPDWERLVTSSEGRMSDLQLQNWFSVVVAGKVETAIPGEETQPPGEPCISTKRKPRLMVV